MHRLRTSRWNHWIGIILVLLPLLAPTVSHALRHAGAITTMQALAGTACLPGQAVVAAASDLQRLPAVDADRHGDPFDVGLHACGYCACPAFGHALPTPSLAFTRALQATRQIDMPADERLPRSRSERPRARSPPARG
jgi:Protein of unknown function (DUF2946)